MSHRHQPFANTRVLMSTCASGRSHASSHRGFASLYAGQGMQAVVVAAVVVIVAVAAVVAVVEVVVEVADEVSLRSTV